MPTEANDDDKRLPEDDVLIVNGKDALDGDVDGEGDGEGDGGDKDETEMEPVSGNDPPSSHHVTTNSHQDTPVEVRNGIENHSLHATKNPTERPTEDLGKASLSVALESDKSGHQGGLDPETFRDQEAHLVNVLSETSTEVAQHVMRKNWRLLLFENYNTEHISYILRAALKNSDSEVLERILRDPNLFSKQFAIVASRKPSVVSRVYQNATAAECFEYLPPELIDLITAYRLKTAPAKELIKWLAQADRLGYKMDDILDDEDESVLPNIDSYPQTPTIDERAIPGSGKANGLASPYQDPLLAEQQRQSFAQQMTATSTPNNGMQQPQLQSQPLQTPQESSKLSTICPLCRTQLPSFSGYTWVGIPSARI